MAFATDEGLCRRQGQVVRKAASRRDNHSKVLMQEPD